ncbi:HNH endonuclease [Rhodobacterales bacterium]|nr:HNH endonuclease [Rhodobacterales bacterium]
MKLTFDLSALDFLVRRMGARETGWRLVGADIAAREKLRTQLEIGKEITFDEIDQKGGLLEHEGEQVLLYIKDTRSSKDTLLKSPEDSRRFHFAECSALSTMRKNNRFSRYHVTKRFDGKFNCTWYDPEKNEHGEVLSALKVCKNCLQEVGWKKYNEALPKDKLKIWKDFDIPEFLRCYETVFYTRPERGDSHPVTPTYIRNWPEISKSFRAARRWRCDRCNVDLSDHRRLLHCHHISGDLGNNSPANLEALCVLCHAEEPHHGRMSCTSAERATIESLRLSKTG